MESSNPKVLFFDSWKGGIHNFLRLAPALHATGFETLLIHLGSWGNEENFEKEELIDGLVVRDISYYKKQRFNWILDQENPDLVLFLSSHTFAHRAFNRLCLHKNIPTINLYHGLVRVQAVDTGKGPYKVNFKSYALFVLKRLPKLFTRTLPTYTRSLIRTNAPIRDWFAYGRNILETFSRPSALRVASDAKTTCCLVYADTDKPHAMRTYGFREEEVIAVGNPDLVRFGLTLKEIASAITVDLRQFRDVMYIDTALTATGLIVNSQSAYISHLLETQQSLKTQGKKLIFKPHPETKRLCDLTALSSAGVELVDNVDVTRRLEECCAVITEPSTLALIPALMALPLFLAQYGRLKELNFGEVLTTYPRSLLLNNLNDFSKDLEQLIVNEDGGAIRNWIQLNSGPLPAEDMPNRVVKVIDDLLNKKKSNLEI